MRSDDGVYVVHDEIGDAEAFGYFRLKQFDILDAVAVSDEDGLRCWLDGGFLHMVDKGFDGLLASANFFHRNKSALAVNVKHRLDIEHRARPGARAAHASAAEQKHQVVDGEPVAQMVSRLHDEIAHFIERCSFLRLLAGEVYEHALPARCRERLFGSQGALRVFFGELLHEKGRCLVGSGKSAREAQVENIISLFENGAQCVFGFLHVGKGCGDHLALAHHGVELLEVGFRPFEIAAMLYAVHHKCQRQNFQTEFVNHLFDEIAGGVGHNAVSHESSFCCFEAGIASSVPWRTVPHRLRCDEGRAALVSQRAFGQNRQEYRLCGWGRTKLYRIHGVECHNFPYNRQIARNTSRCSACAI